MPYLTKSILSSLEEPLRSMLLSMYAGECQPGADGERHSIDLRPGHRHSPRGRDVDPSTVPTGQATSHARDWAGLRVQHPLLSGRARGGWRRRPPRDRPVPDDPPGRWPGIEVAQGKICGGERFRLIEERLFAALNRPAGGSERLYIIVVDGASSL